MKAWNETGSIGEWFWLVFLKNITAEFPSILAPVWNAVVKPWRPVFPFFCTCSCIIQTEKKTKVSGHKHNILKSWSHLTNKRQRSKYLCVVWSKITGNVNQEKCVWSESRQQNFPSVVTFSLELCVFNQTFVAMYLRAFQHPALHWNAQFHLCVSVLTKHYPIRETFDSRQVRTCSARKSECEGEELAARGN